MGGIGALGQMGEWRSSRGTRLIAREGRRLNGECLPSRGQVREVVRMRDGTGDASNVQASHAGGVARRSQAWLCGG